MRPGLGGDTRVAERLRKRADYAADSSYPTYIELFFLPFEITEAGLYRIGWEVNIQAPGNNALNEYNTVLELDGMVLRPRTNAGMFNNTVPSRDYHSRELTCYLAEGGHYAFIKGFCAGTGSLILSTYFLDCEHIWVDKL